MIKISYLMIGGCTMNFFKKNKFKILWISLFIIMCFAFFSTALGVETTVVEFTSGKVIANCLNIRCGPGIQYKKIGKLNKNDYIEVYAQLGEWYVIKTENNLVGTVNAKYVDLITKEELENIHNISNLEKISTEEMDGKENVEYDIKGEDDIAETQSEIILDVSNSEYLNSSELTEDEQEFLNLVNVNRENNGLAILEIGSEVQNIARLKAKDLVENNYFSHTSEKYGDIPAMFTDFGITYKTVGENIAGNNNISGAVEAWMNSENHRANLLSKDYNYTGVAVVESELYGKIFVQVFVGK